MPERTRFTRQELKRLTRDAVYFVGAGASIYVLATNIDLTDASLAALRLLTDYDRHSDEGTADNISLKLVGPRRFRNAFADLVSDPHTPWKSVINTLVYNPDVLQVEERPCLLGPDITVQKSIEIPENYKTGARATINAQEVIRIVGSSQLIVPGRAVGLPRYVNTVGVLSR